MSADAADEAPEMGGYEPEPVEVRIQRDADREAIGTMLFVTATELAELGVDPSTEAVTYYVDAGYLHVE